jgi:hypothetical protein
LLKRKNNNWTYEPKYKVKCSLEDQGVDINRNYGYAWGNKYTPCDEEFPGPFAFSEPET